MTANALLHIQKELLQTCGTNGWVVSHHLSRPDRCSEVREDCGTSRFYITHLQKDRLALNFLKKGEEEKREKKKTKPTTTKKLFQRVHLFKIFYVPYNFMETVSS